MNNGLKDDHTNFRSRKICLTFLIEKIGPDHSKQDFKARHQNGVHYDTVQKITRSNREWEDVSWDRKSLPFPFCCLNRNSSTDMPPRLKKPLILNSPVMRDKTDRANCAKCCITTKTHLKYLNNLCFSCLVCYGIFKLIYPYLRQTPSDWASNHSYLFVENNKPLQVSDESSKIVLTNKL